MRLLFDTLFNMYTVIGFFYIWEGYKISKRSIPEKVIQKLKEDELDAWCNARRAAKVLGAMGFLIFPISELLIETGFVDIRFIVLLNCLGLLFIFASPVLSIRNNNKKLGVWSSTFL